MKKRNSSLIYVATLASLLSSVATFANPIPYNIEELRVNTAQQALPQMFNRFNALSDALEVQFTQSTNEFAMTNMVALQGHKLWQQAVIDVQTGHVDDRPLYWSRLNMRTMIKQQKAGFNIVQWQRDVLLSAVEKSSRGFSDINFAPDSQIKILLTGFDPFFLDKDLGQSNPSGVTALSLDGFRFNVNGKKAQIETVMIPVRFKDFDDGIIESLLTPFYRDSSIDMVITVSMGRENFDLERFPARNRSAAAPDNLNILTGANHDAPKPPLFNGGTLNGAEFVEFSLPADAMKAVKGRWQVKDNHQVKTLSKGQFDATSLSSLQDETSVEGSGGGYLSNEISYRSILMRDQFNLRIPVGHIHTPKVKGHDSQDEADIADQVKKMVIAAAATL